MIFFFYLYFNFGKVISFFKAQVDLINTKLGKKKAIQVNFFLKIILFISFKVTTIDAFQGGEKSIIVLSMVKISGLSGFIDNKR